MSEIVLPPAPDSDSEHFDIYQNYEIEAERRDELKQYLKDRGIGIPERDLPFILQPFFRGRNAKKLPGTGLGLSLAWYILKLHGGNLEVDSRERRGTKVSLIVPETNTTGLSYSI